MTDHPTPDEHELPNGDLTAVSSHWVWVFVTRRPSPTPTGRCTAC